MSWYFFYAAYVSLGLALVLYLWHLLSRVVVMARRYATAPQSPSDEGQSNATVVGRHRASGGTMSGTIGQYSTVIAINGFAFLTLSLLLRAMASGRGPFGNMYEFSAAFAWGVLLLYLYIEAQYKVRSLGLFVVPIALALVWYASTLPADIEPLVPALQNNLLLTVHVAVAIIAYGGFAVAFGAAVLYLLQRGDTLGWLPSSRVLDEIGYRSVVIGFPMMFLVIVLGAIWADTAWGRYWNWDPKETASLVTWLIYGGYLHARNLRGWRGTPSAVLLIIGFAATLVTYFGNLFFGGLHSYSGV